jgi:outer membrane protein assembly factor BamB
MSRSLLSALCLLILTALVSPSRADSWPAWRGPDGTGVTKERDLPLKWSPDENVRWKVKLPGPGNSTPVIWGERLFLTQATDKGHKRGTLCFDRKDGKKRWEQWVEYKPDEPTHGTNPYCSASPATDGERLVVSHGSAGVYCYDLDGKELWSRDLGPCRHIWGNAASPVIHGDLVILNFGPGPQTFLLAMDKKTGKDVWKVEEPGGKSGEKDQAEWTGSWSTPMLLNVKGREQLIMSWPTNVKAYDPKTGTLLWTCQGLERGQTKLGLVYTSPLVSSEAVVAFGGYGGPYLAVKPDGEGDVTSTHRLWRQTSAPQRIGSGVILGEHVYMVNEPGTAQLIELKTGKTVWTERVGAGVWGSLVHSGDRLYVTNLEGETLVLAAGPKFEVLARNALKERTLASIAVSDGCLYIRTYQHLWCIGK